MRRNRTNQAFALVMSVVVCAFVGAAAQEQVDGTKMLTVYPVPQTAGAAELQLLPKAQELTDADAFPFYVKAVKLLPKDMDWQKIKAWRQMPVSQLSQEEVGPVLRQFGTSLPLFEQAGKCKRCDWPLSFEGDPPIDLTACRNMVFLLALRARVELARGDCASCVGTLRTGLALAKHLAEGPSAIHLLVGVAVGAIVYGGIEQYVQQPGALSLEAAIQAIPRPLFDEKHSDLYGMDAGSRSKAQLVVGRANRHVIALQYIETLRLYATRAGKWPQTLDELKASLPDDPVAGKPFMYKRLSETQVLLEGLLPKGGGTRDVVRYELTMVK